MPFEQFLPKFLIMKATEDFTRTRPLKNNMNDYLAFEIYRLRRFPENPEDLFNVPQNDGNFKIIWITTGRGVHYLDFQKITVSDNRLFFVKPNQVYQFNLAGPVEGYCISFAESFLCIEDQECNSTYHSSLFKLFAGAGGITIQNDFIDMKNIAEKMIEEFDGENLFRAEILRRYFKILLIYIKRQLEGKFETLKPSRNIEIVQQFMNLLEKNFKELKMVSDYASMLSVTPNYLNEIIKKITGFSASHHIRQRIVLEAKRQATYSDCCMKEIAYLLGFCDIAHFSKFFKNTAGINFSDFKREKGVLSAATSAPN